MEPESTSNESGSVVDTPGRNRPWSPFVRLALLGTFLATLPFPWGESSSCNGPVHVYTGYEQATKSSGTLLPFLVIFIGPFLLGLIAYFTRAAWIKFGLDFIAALFSSFGAFYCFVSAAFGGSLLERHNRVYLAPWIAMVAVFLMSIDALWNAASQLQVLVRSHRELHKAKNSARDAPPPSPD